jgi:8-oxo-dGTP pyrophosphatase MutT (NUDIX family)
MALDRLQRDLDAHPAYKVDSNNPTPRAAVALVFRPGADLLFIERAARENDPWSGHMAFPGGRFDASDASLQATAMRETREEVGLDLSPARVLGALSELPTPARLPVSLVISPFSFALDADPVLATNHEVAKTHWFALERLLEHEGRDTFEREWRGGNWSLPCLRLDGTFIWGITLRILDEALDRIRRGGE